MKKLMMLAALAALITGCASAPNVDTGKIMSAIVNGYLTYEQIKALKEEAEKEQASVEAPEAEVAAPVVTEGQAAKPEVAQPAIVPASGKAVAVFLGNRATCSYCKKLAALNPEPYIETVLSDVDWIDADKVTASATYAKYRPKTGFSYPFIRVYDEDGVFKGEFVARNMTLEKIAAKIKEVCPSCAD
ncbi:MAG: hypothetical protein BWY66_00540 [bacterium ADurb.Bin374]|nr:MAG: hypothetical protein BWY66_00540 [bacterium ADurb.Bin374]